MNGRFNGRDAAAASYLIALAVLFVAPAIVSGGTVGQYPSDGTRLMYMTREYLVGSLHAGRVPVWNPFMQFGAPFMADIQWAVFYPLNLLFLPMSSDLAYNLFLAVHLALAGIFMYLLARDWNLSRPAATVAGTAFMLSGRMVTAAWGGTVNVVSPVAWLPLVVLLVDRTLTSRRPVRWGGLAVLAFAVELLSGHPQHTFFTIVAVLALAIWRGLERSLETRRLISAVTPGAVVLVILVGSAGLAAIQLAPTYEAMKLSTRVFEWKLAWPPPAVEGAYNPLRLVTWIVPDLFGNAVSLRPAATDWLSLLLHELHSHEFPAYIGVLPLLLGLFSLTQWRVAPRVRFLWGLAALAMLFAFGAWTPVYGLAYAAVPPFRPFRVPARFLTLVVFSLSLLSGFGADALLADAGQRARRWSRAVLAVAVLCLAGAAFAAALRGPLLEYGHRLAAPLFATRPSGQALAADQRDALIAAAFGLTVRGVFVAALLLLAASEVFRQSARPRFSGNAIALAIVAIAGVDLGLHAVKYTASESMAAWFARSAPIVNAIRTAGPREYEYSLAQRASPDPVRPSDNIFIHEQLHTAGGYESFELATYRPLRDLLDADLRRGSSYVADVFGIRFVASDAPMPGQSFRPIAASDTAVLYENDGALPRAYVAGRARPVARAVDAFDELTHAAVAPGDEVLIETTASAAAGTAGRAGHAAIVAESPDQIGLDVVAERDAYLVLNDTYYPGWTATVDDREEHVFRANSHVRAVHVTAGHHLVTMRFTSSSLARGRTISIAAALAASLIVAVGVAMGR